MKVVYIAHPIGGDVPGNVAKVKEILKQESTRFVHPIAPYLAALEFLDDSKSEDRELGIAYNQEYFTRKVMDEVWVYGGVSRGVKAEIELASRLGIPVLFKF